MFTLRHRLLTLRTAYLLAFAVLATLVMVKDWTDIQRHEVFKLVFLLIAMVALRFHFSGRRAGRAPFRTRDTAERPMSGHRPPSR